MKKLLLILLCLPMIGFGQACQYGSSIDASEICDFYKGNNFATYKNADIALDKILAVTGLSKNFALKECKDISNCVATTYKGIRYILFDKEFMDAIATRTNSWSSISILAHEIGHHVNGHTLGEKEITLSESRQMELEADEYSGFVMFKLGTSLSQAQEAIRLISTNADDSYSTHPSRDKRLRAIERGYVSSKLQSSNDNVNLSAKEYHDKAMEHLDLASELLWKEQVESAVRNSNLAIENWNQAIELNPTNSWYYWGKATAEQGKISAIRKVKCGRFLNCLGWMNSNIETLFKSKRDNLTMAIKMYENYKQPPFPYNVEVVNFDENSKESDWELGHLYSDRGFIRGGFQELGFESDYKKACELGMTKACKAIKSNFKLHYPAEGWWQNAAGYFVE